MRHLLRLLSLALLLPLALVQAADSPPDSYRVGDPITPFTIKDQHDQALLVSAAEGIRHVIVSFDMPTGRDANRYFEKRGAAFLPENDAIFLANIHGMPAIGRLFALPKMKKYPHRILLGDDEHLLDRYPAQDGKLTVLDLAPDGRITAVRFLDPEKDLDQLFAR